VVIRWQAIVAALVLFFAGVLSGVMGQRLWDRWQVAEIPTQQPRRGEPPAPSAGPRLTFLQRMTKDLELSPEQAERINTIIKASQERMHELWKPTVTRARLEMSNTHQAIRTVLNEKQRVRMEELFSKRRDRGRRGGGRFHPGDGPAEKRPAEHPRRRFREGQDGAPSDAAHPPSAAAAPTNAAPSRSSRR
jgi:Spy/CpxP family protein refolding chaperone